MGTDGASPDPCWVCLGGAERRQLVLEEGSVLPQVISLGQGWTGRTLPLPLRLWSVTQEFEEMFGICIMKWKPFV